MTKPTRKRWTKETYSEYLQTERWQTLRESMLDAAGHRCQLCNGDGELHVHHRGYDNLGQEGERRDLMVLCKACHQKYHSKLYENFSEEDKTAMTMLRTIGRMAEMANDILMGASSLLTEQELSALFDLSIQMSDACNEVWRRLNNDTEDQGNNNEG